MNILVRLACRGFATLDHRPSTDLYLVARVVDYNGATPTGRPGQWVVGLDLAGDLARSFVDQGSRRSNVAEGLPTISLDDVAASEPVAVLDSTGPEADA